MQQGHQYEPNTEMNATECNGNLNSG